MSTRTHTAPSNRRSESLPAASFNRKGPPRSPDIAKGHRDRDRCFLDPPDRNAGHARSYKNVLLLRLHQARRQGPEVEEGFTMILNDFVATVCGGTTIDPGYYDRLADRGVIERASGVVLEPYGPATAVRL